MICVATAALFNLILYITASFGGPLGLLIPVIGVLLLKLPRKNVVVFDGKKVGVLRRVLGFFIDIYVVLMSTLPIVATFTLMLEYIATGNWQWSFERETFRWWTDIPNILMTLLVFYCLYYYRRWHFDRSWQTLGQYLLGYKLIKGTGDVWDDYSRIKAVRMRKA